VVEVAAGLPEEEVELPTRPVVIDTPVVIVVLLTRLVVIQIPVVIIGPVEVEPVVVPVEVEVEVEVLVREPVEVVVTGV